MTKDQQKYYDMGLTKGTSLKDTHLAKNPKPPKRSTDIHEFVDSFMSNNDTADNFEVCVMIRDYLRLVSK